MSSGGDRYAGPRSGVATDSSKIENRVKINKDVNDDVNGTLARLDS